MAYKRLQAYTVLTNNSDEKQNMSQQIDYSNDYRDELIKNLQQQLEDAKQLNAR